MAGKMVERTVGVLAGVMVDYWGHQKVASMVGRLVDEMVDLLELTLVV